LASCPSNHRGPQHHTNAPQQGCCIHRGIAAHSTSLWRASTPLLSFGTMVCSHPASPAKVILMLDPENCSLASGSVARHAVHRITDIAHEYGDVISFKAYNGIQVPNEHRPDLHCSGVSVIDCPHNGGKNVVDNTLIG
jgi:hypothetical protein